MYLLSLALFVAPAKAGVQGGGLELKALDSRLCGNDDFH